MAIITELQEPDFSLPISTILREGTSEAHEAAENSQGAGWLTRGELDKNEYVRFLMMLWHIYDILEQGLERHASHPTLQPTYNPTLLGRTPNLASDISYLLQTSVSDWKEHPVHTSLLSSPPVPFTEYTSRLQTLSDSADPSPLLAHAYVRYLGDLSGGQFIRRRIIKAYGLNASDGSGATFYDFKELGGSRSGTLGDMKRIKEWYRKGMDAGVGDNRELKREILKEANFAFELNSGIFAALKAPSGKFHHEDDDVGSTEIPVQVQHEPQERMVTLASVISVVVAACLTHFLLVVGGFTSTRGYEKLLALEQWLQASSE